MRAPAVVTSPRQTQSYLRGLFDERGLQPKNKLGQNFLIDLNFLVRGTPFERMVVTVQWEIAERLMAAPGGKEYGALSVLVQSLADVRLVRKLAPTVFWPRPQVDSAIIDIRPDAAKRAHVGDV